MCCNRPKLSTLVETWCYLSFCGVSPQNGPLPILEVGVKAFNGHGGPGSRWPVTAAERLGLRIPDQMLGHSSPVGHVIWWTKMDLEKHLFTCHPFRSFYIYIHFSFPWYVIYVQSIMIILSACPWEDLFCASKREACNSWHHQHQRLLPFKLSGDGSPAWDTMPAAGPGRYFAKTCSTSESFGYLKSSLRCFKIDLVSTLLDKLCLISWAWENWTSSMFPCVLSNVSVLSEVLTGINWWMMWMFWQRGKNNKNKNACRLIHSGSSCPWLSTMRLIDWRDALLQVVFVDFCVTRILCTSGLFNFKSWGWGSDTTSLKPPNLWTNSGCEWSMFLPFWVLIPHLKDLLASCDQGHASALSPNSTGAWWFSAASFRWSRKRSKEFVIWSFTDVDPSWIGSLRL